MAKLRRGWKRSFKMMFRAVFSRKIFGIQRCSQKFSRVNFWDFSPMYAPDDIFSWKCGP